MHGRSRCSALHGTRLRVRRSDACTQEVPLHLRNVRVQAIDGRWVGERLLDGSDEQRQASVQLFARRLHRRTASRVCAGSGLASGGQPGSVAIVTAPISPRITPESLSGMVIIGSWTTTFYPDISNGYGANIRVPAKLLNGQIVEPGQRFSFLTAVSPIDEAHGYEQLAGQFQLTQEEIAVKVGKSRAVVANAMRLLKLPQVVQNYVREGRLSVGHAKVILGLADEKKQQFAAERVIKQGLNVRQTEGFVAKLQKRGTHKSTLQPETVAPPGSDPHVADLEARLREVFATKVQLHYAEGKGMVEITFFSDEELERILQILGVSAE